MCYKGKDEINCTIEQDIYDLFIELAVLNTRGLNLYFILSNSVVLITKHIYLLELSTEIKSHAVLDH